MMCVCATCAPSARLLVESGGGVNAVVPRLPSPAGTRRACIEVVVGVCAHAGMVLLHMCECLRCLIVHIFRGGQPHGLRHELA